jgi:hypothetical protein
MVITFIVSYWYISILGIDSIFINKYLTLQIAIMKIIVCITEIGTESKYLFSLCLAKHL